MPKGRPFSEDFKQAVRDAYANLPRCPFNRGKRPGARPKKGTIPELCKRFGISQKVLWDIVYGLHEWNKGRKKP